MFIFIFLLGMCTYCISKQCFKARDLLYYFRKKSFLNKPKFQIQGWIYFHSSNEQQFIKNVSSPRTVNNNISKWKIFWHKNWVISFFTISLLLMSFSKSDPVRLGWDCDLVVVISLRSREGGHYHNFMAC